MQITVFGANGKVGRLVVAEALRRGHTVGAFVHNHSSLPTHDRLRTARGDIYDAAQVAASIEGSDAVVSTLSSWGTAHKDVLATAMEHLVPAMQSASVQRLVSLTGADARASSDALSPIHRLSHRLIAVGAGKVLADGERHISLLEQSGLDYTVLRSPIMLQLGNAMAFQLIDSRPLPWATIHRLSVAVAMVDQLEDRGHLRQAPYIVRA